MTAKMSVVVAIAAFLVIQAAAQMGPSPSEGPSGAPDCMTNLLNMTDCLSYVQAGEGGGAAKPDKACCPELAGLVETSPQCLCYLLSGDLAAQYGFKIDKAKALKLPAVCGIVTPPPSLCSLFGVPVGAPGPASLSNEETSPAFAPTSGAAESPGAFASGPATSKQSVASSNTPSPLLRSLIIFPLTLALYIYY